MVLIRHVEGLIEGENGHVTDGEKENLGYQSISHTLLQIFKELIKRYERTCKIISQLLVEKCSCNKLCR